MKKIITLFCVMAFSFLLCFPILADTRMNNVDLEENGIGTWEGTDEKHRYILELYKDGYMIGEKHFTYGSEFDFSPLMQQEGDYHYEIGIYDADYQELGMIQSTGAYIDRNKATENRSKYEIRYDDDVPLGLAWNKSDGDWRYRCKDGIFLQSDYLYLDGATFYFDSDGYMVTDTWIDENGSLMYFDKYGQYDMKKKEGQ